MPKDLLLETIPVVSGTPCKGVHTEDKLEKTAATLFAEGLIWLAQNPKRGL